MHDKRTQYLALRRFGGELAPATRFLDPDYGVVRSPLGAIRTSGDHSLRTLEVIRMSISNQR